MTLTDLERRVEELERWRYEAADYTWGRPIAPPQPREQEKCCAVSGTYACVCNRYVATPQPSEQEQDNAVLFHAFRNLREILAGMDTTTAPSRLTVALIRTHLANIEREIALPTPPQAGGDGVPVRELNAVLEAARSHILCIENGPSMAHKKMAEDASEPLGNAIRTVRAWLVLRGQR